MTRDLESGNESTDRHVRMTYMRVDLQCQEAKPVRLSLGGENAYKDCPVRFGQEVVRDNNLSELLVVTTAG